MAEFQRIGDKQELKKGPKSYDRSRFSGGGFNLVGDSVSMSAKPVPIQDGNKHIAGGKFQQLGDNVSLGQSPQKGWESHATPMSDRAWQQSAMPGAGKGKKGKG